MNTSTKKTQLEPTKTTIQDTQTKTNLFFFEKKSSPHKKTHKKNKHIPNPPGFYCDILVLSPESWRHLGAGAGTVVPLVRAGLESYDGPQGWQQGGLVNNPLLRLYTPENKHGSWKYPLGKGETSTNHQFLGSMFVLGGVFVIGGYLTVWGISVDQPWWLVEEGGVCCVFFSPPVRWGLLDFMSVFSSSSASSSSSSSSSSSFSSSSFSSCDDVWSVWRAGPQPRSCEASVACRTSTAIMWGQCGVPDLNRDHVSSVWRAGPQPRNGQKEECQKDCQKLCQKECQTECRRSVRKNVRKSVRQNVRKNVKRYAGCSRKITQKFWKQLWRVCLFWNAMVGITRSKVIVWLLFFWLLI